MSNGHARAIETGAFVRDTIKGVARGALVPCVAVVDDDDSIRFLVETLLKRDGLAAATYPSAEAFLDAPDSRSARFLVFDLHLPSAVKNGAVDFVEKPFDNKELLQNPAFACRRRARRIAPPPQRRRPRCGAVHPSDARHAGIAGGDKCRQCSAL